MSIADEIRRIYETQGTAAAAKAAQDAGGYLFAGGTYRPAEHYTPTSTTTTPGGYETTSYTYTPPPSSPTPTPTGPTAAEIAAQMEAQLAQQQAASQAQLAQLQSQLGSISSMYEGQINELMNRMAAEQQAHAATQTELKGRLGESEAERQAVAQRVAYYTSPEYMAEGAALAREHMLPGQQADQARILQAILSGAEQRGLTHSGLQAGLEQQALQHLDEQYAKQGLEIARQLALMGVAGAEQEYENMLRQIQQEAGILTGGHALSYDQLMGMLGHAHAGLGTGLQAQIGAAGLGQQAAQFGQTHALQQFQAMAPYMLMTQAEQASYVRNMMQDMALPTAGMTDAELSQVFELLMGAGGAY